MTEKDRLEQDPAGLSDEELAATAEPIELPGREALSMVTLGGPNLPSAAAAAAAAQPDPGQIELEPGVPTE